jgi:hypothetical protein
MTPQAENGNPLPSRRAVRPAWGIVISDMINVRNPILAASRIRQGNFRLFSSNLETGKNIAIIIIAIMTLISIE